MKEKSHKVICIGMMKTGTTTLNRALSILGYRVSHDSWKWLPHIVSHDWDRVRKEMERWDAVEDNPIPLIYKELDTMFPGSKFIYTQRDPEKWYQSVSYHIGDLVSPMHAWLFGKGKALPKRDRAHSLAVFNRHRDGVRAYFKDRQSDLLVMDVTKTASWDELCAFLGEPIPDTPFPHANRTAYQRSKYTGLGPQLKYWKKRMINPIKIAWYKKKGYLPSPNERLQQL